MSLLNNSRERFPDQPRPLTPQRLEAVEARMPIRLKAAQNVWQTTKMSFPELWVPAPAVPQMPPVQPKPEASVNANVPAPQFSPTEWASKLMVEDQARRLVDDAFKGVEADTVFAQNDMQQAGNGAFSPNPLGDDHAKEAA